MIDLKMRPCPNCIKKDGEWFCTLTQKPYYAVQKCPKYALWKMVKGGLTMSKSEIEISAENAQNLGDLIFRGALLEELQQSPWIADIQELPREEAEAALKRRSNDAD